MKKGQKYGSETCVSMKVQVSDPLKGTIIDITVLIMI